MKKIAAMTAIIALVSMPVLAAGQGGFTGPSTTTTTQGWRLHRAERRGDHRGERQVAA